MQASAHTYSRTHARTRARTHARTHARAHARTHARTHTHTHTHTHIFVVDPFKQKKKTVENDDERIRQMKSLVFLFVHFWLRKLRA